jgi:hypothetical protein
MPPHVLPPAAYQPEDFEPLLLGDCLDEALGPHWIGRLDESLSDVALLFDTRWLGHADAEEAIWDHLSQRSPNGMIRYTHWGYYGSKECSRDELFSIFRQHTLVIRPFDFPEEDRIFLVGITAPLKVVGDALCLKVYPPFVGHADMSWPNDLATIVRRDIPTPWELAFEHANDPKHWMHTLAV